MNIYAVIHTVVGLAEDYSDTVCEFFPTKKAAKKHVKQILAYYREISVHIDHSDGDDVRMTMGDADDYKACVPRDLGHDDWVTKNDATVEVLRTIKIDVSRYENYPTTEHIWLTWDQQDSSVAWDYFPLCMSLVKRVSQDALDISYATPDDSILRKLVNFIDDVYHKDQALIDYDNYVLQVFRIPKMNKKTKKSTSNL